MRYSLLLIYLCALLCCSCIAPVRTNYFPERVQKDKKEEPKVQPAQLEGIKTAGTGRRDTLVIDYTTPLRQQTGQGDQPRESLPVTGRVSLEESFESALLQFDNSDYDNACMQFRSIAETLPSDDSLAYEARFMEAECSVVNNKLLIALSTLISLSLDVKTPTPVLEKALIRKGQVQCLLNEFDSATETFRQFQTRFPNSAYLPLANCNAAH